MFERFTDRARRILVLAQESTRLLKHNEIGTGHLLLGMIIEGDGIAGQALESLNLGHDTVAGEIQTIKPPDPRPNQGIPPFTPVAKKSMELALREALQLGHNYIGTEHLLLGIIRGGEGTAIEVLGRLGIEPSHVRKTVIEILSGHRPGLPLSSMVNFELTPSLAKAVQVRVGHLRRAIGDTSFDLPVNLEPHSAMEGQLSLTDCHVFLAWYSSLAKALGLSAQHPFSVVTRNIEAGINRAKAEHVRRTQSA